MIGRIDILVSAIFANMTHDRPFAAFAPPIRQRSPLRAAITAAYRRDEAECLAPLLDAATLDTATKAAVADTARQLVTALRANHKGTGLEGSFFRK